LHEGIFQIPRVLLLVASMRAIQQHHAS
jgi:hypothetical protein